MTDNTTPDIHRLCEYEPDGQAGCRRTMTILALEAEFDTFVSPEMFWGFWDQFCIHEGHSYYEKAFLQKNITDDSAAQGDMAKLNELFDMLGYRLGYDNLSLDTIRDLFKSNPAGLPAFVSETPQFFECEDVGSKKINIDDLDRALLDRIRDTFVDDVHPLLSNTADCLHDFNGKIFCTDVLAYENNPNGKLGLFMVPSVTEKYTVGEPYFFPFAPLTAEQLAIVELYSDIDTEFTGKKLTIVDL